MEELDWHGQAEDRFAADAAIVLARGVELSTDKHVVAPLRTLARSHRHYSRTVSSRIVAEIDRGQTIHPIEEIIAILMH